MKIGLTRILRCFLSRPILPRALDRRVDHPDLADESSKLGHFEQFVAHPMGRQN